MDENINTNGEPSSNTLPEDFDFEYYLLQNKDVKDAGIDAIAHYLNHGRQEGRVYKKPTINNLDWDGTNPKLLINELSIILKRHMKSTDEKIKAAITAERVRVQVVDFVRFSSLNTKKSRSIGIQSPGSFSENSKYLFLHILKLANRENLEVHWITSSKDEHEMLNAVGLPTILWDGSKTAINALLNQKVIVSSTNLPSGGLYQASIAGATYLRLSRGIPMQSVGIDSITPSTSLQVYSNTLHERYFCHHVAVESEAVLPKYQKAYPKASIIVSGKPKIDSIARTDDLSEFYLTGVNHEIYGITQKAKSDYKKIVLLTPNLGDGAKDLEGTTQFLARFFDAAAEIKDSIFLVHLAGSSNFEKINEPNKSSKLAERIFLIDGDIYPFLKYVDILISDYSELAVDFTLCDKPIWYIENEIANNDLIDTDLFDIRKSFEKCCRIAFGGNNFIEELNTPEPDQLVRTRRDFSKKMFKHEADGMACARIFDEVIRWLN